VFEDIATGDNFSVFFTAIYDAGAMFLGGSFRDLQIDVEGRIGDDFRSFTSRDGGRLHFKDLGKQPSQEVTYADLINYYALGIGTLEIDGNKFDIYIANLAGNPLAIDMNSNGRIDGEDIKVITLDGTVFSVEELKLRTKIV